MYGIDCSLSAPYEISGSASEDIYSMEDFVQCLQNMFPLQIAKLVPEFNSVADLFRNMMNMTFSQNSKDTFCL